MAFKKLNFTLYMDDIRNDSDRVSLLLGKYARDIFQSRKTIDPYDMQTISVELRSLRTSLKALIDPVAKMMQIDPTGNKYQGFRAYNRIEFITRSDYRSFVSIRLMKVEEVRDLSPVSVQEESLGLDVTSNPCGDDLDCIDEFGPDFVCFEGECVHEDTIAEDANGNRSSKFTASVNTTLAPAGDPPPLFTTKVIHRFELFNVTNDVWDRATTNIISDVHRIASHIEDVGGVEGVSQALRCADDTDSLATTLDQGANIFEIANEAQTSVTSNLTWSNFVNKYFIPRPRISSTSVELTPEQVRGMLVEFDTDEPKTQEQVNEENARMASVQFKIKLGEANKKGFMTVNASAGVLEDPAVLLDKLDTLEDAFVGILDRYSLGCLVKQAAECILPPISCREILRGLRVSNIADKIGNLFPNQPSIGQKAQEAMKEVEGLSEAEQADAFLDIIENFVDLEAVCYLGIPEFEFSLPEFPVTDLFGQLSISINDAIIDALIAAIVGFIEGILGDLLTCDNLDAFIDAALNGDLEGFGDEIEGRLEGRLGEFGNSIGSAFENVVQVDANLGASIGDQTFGVGASTSAGFGGLGDAILSGDPNSITFDTSTNVDALADIQSPIGGRTTIIGDTFDSSTPLTDTQKKQVANNEKIKQAIKATGEFEQNADGTFTLSTLADFNLRNAVISSINTTPINKPLTQEQLLEAFRKLNTDVLAIFTPSNALKLYAGDPTRIMLQQIKDLIDKRHPDLKFMSNLMMIKNLFATFGKLTGLASLKDSLIFDNILDVACRDRRTSKPLCLEDTRNFDGTLDDIINNRRDRYNDIGLALDHIRNGAGISDIVGPILCSRNPDGTRNPVVEQSLNTTISAMFQPTRSQFDQEVMRYPNAISGQRKVTKKIPRTVRPDPNSPTFNGGLFSTLEAFAQNQDLTISPNAKTNPEFKKLLSEGFIPINSNGDEDGDPDEDYTDKSTPITKQVIEHEIGLPFKQGMDFESNKFKVKTSGENLDITLKGTLSTLSPTEEYTTFRVPSPKWTIKLEESTAKIDMSIVASGKIQSRAMGMKPFSDNFQFKRDKQEPQGPELGSRADEYAELLYESVLEASEDMTASDTNSIKSFFKNKHELFVNAPLGNQLKNNRLIRKIPNKSLDALGPSDVELKADTSSNLVALNFISFASEATPSQRACGAEPHLLDLEMIKRIVKEENDKGCEKGITTPSGLDSKPSPVSEAGMVGAVLTVMRLYAVEYVLRSLMVFDEFNYSESLASDELFVSFVAERMAASIKEQGILRGKKKETYWSRFRKEVRIAYRKMRTNKEFLNTFPSAFEKPPKETIELNDVTGEMILLMRAQLKSVVKKISKIVGANDKSKLGALPIVDVYSDFEVYDESEDGYTSNNERFSELDFDGIKGRFVLERYIRVPENSTGVPNLNSLQGVVNFNNFKQMVTKNPAFANRDLDYAGLKYGLRLVFVSPSATEPLTANSLRAKESKLFLDHSTESRVSFKSKKARLESAYEVLERSRTPTTVSSNMNASRGTQDLFSNVQELVTLPVINNADGEPLYRRYNIIPIATSESFINSEDISRRVKIRQTSSILGEIQNIDNTMEQLKDARRSNPTSIINEQIDKNRVEKNILEAKLQNVEQKILKVGDILSTKAYSFEDSGKRKEVLESELAELLLGLTEGGTTQRALLDIEKKKQEINNLPRNLFLSDTLERVFEKDIKKELLEEISRNPKTDRLFNYCLFSDRISSVLAIHSCMIHNSEDIQNLFVGTRSTLKVLFENLSNTGDFNFGDPFDLSDDMTNAVAYKRAINNIGNPNGPSDGQAAWFALITPLMIFKGIVELIDPAIAAASKIAQSAATGFLSPQLRKQGDVIVVDNTGKPQIVYSRVEMYDEGREEIITKSGPDEDGYEPGTSAISNSGEFIPGKPASSEPIYPGDPVNIPVGLLAMSILPINIFGFIIPWNFCGPPITPLAIPYMFLEPLWMEFPYYQITAQKTNTAQALKEDSGIDVNGAKNIGCDDNKED